MNESLTICISTCNDNILNIKLCPGFKYLICHQVINGKNYDDTYLSLGVPVVKMDELGLSKNRNKLLAEVTTPYAYLTDDDVDINGNGLISLLSVIQSIDCEVICGAVKTPSGKWFKSYPKEMKRLSFLELAKVSSVEMLINAKRIRELQCIYDESFGLGSSFPSGEEFIFLSDVYKSGGKIYYFPCVVCMHPEVSSGQDFYSEPIKIIAKSKMFERVFNRKAYFYKYMFFLKKFATLYENKKISVFVKNFF